MAEHTLRDLVRKVLAGGLALGGSARELPAIPAAIDLENRPLHDPGAESSGRQGSDLILRNARPRVLLRALDATRIALISSHRSHRSHSSHYSSSRSSPPPPRPAPTPAPKPEVKSAPVKKDTSRPLQGGDTGRTARPLLSSSSDSATLGNRVLSLGMRGSDVEQLLILLLRQKLLSADKVPSESIFNKDVESAVMRFQLSKGITVDGKVDFRTLLLLKAQ